MWSILFNLFNFSLLEPLIKALGKLLEGFSPLIQGASNGIVALAQTVWQGLQDILDNWKTILTVAIMCFASGVYARDFYKQDVKCKHVIDQLHRDYTFVPKKPTKGTTTQSWSFPKWLPL